MIAAKNSNFLFGYKCSRLFHSCIRFVKVYFIPYICGSLLRNTTGTDKSANAESCPQYDPSKTQYDPIEDACWTKDQK